MRNIVYQFDDLQAFAFALGAGDQELVLPPGEKVGDGEWVLAIFEMGGAHGRATAAAARGLDRGGGNYVLVFERRDWERLVQFSEVTSHDLHLIPVEGESETTIPITLDDLPNSVPPPMSTREPPMSNREPPMSSRPSSIPLRAHSAFAAGLNARVLLVDDDRDIREVVGAMLDAVGLIVETATSAEDALERVRAYAFDLIVLDWNLPGMTGIELCRVIRREPTLMTLPVLFLTAHASSKDIVEAFASGADDYVVKPFRAPELGARIFGLLRRVRLVQPST